MDILLEDRRNINKISHENRRGKSKKKKNKKIKRGKGEKNDLELCIMSTNAAQLKGKLDSFKSELKYAKVGLFKVQETHFATKGKV